MIAGRFPVSGGSAGAGPMRGAALGARPFGEAQDMFRPA